MSKSFKALGLAVGALALTQSPAFAQTKVTNEGISAAEIVVGSHQDLSGPIKGWGVPVANGLKMAADEINAAGGINGRKIKLIVEDSGYDGFVEVEIFSVDNWWKRPIDETLSACRERLTSAT